MSTPRVWAEVDLGKLASNFEAIKSRLMPGTGILGIVKANAYGHGAVQVARKLEKLGATGVGVGDALEALELRYAGVTLPIFILGAIAGAEVERVVEADIIPSAHSREMALKLEAEAAKQNKKQKINLLVDTGMGRLGVKPAEIFDLLQLVKNCPHLEIEGISTHFPSASLGDLEFTNYQIMNFDFILREAENMGLQIPKRHSANSSAVFAMTGSHFNMVRPGIALYGMNPGNLDLQELGLNPILSLKTQIVFIKNVYPGTSIGYNRAYFTTKATKIATLSVGYNDGYPWALSNKAHVLIRGKKAPVVGNVSMDYTTVDVGNLPEAKVGDEVVLIGKSENENVSAEEVATLAGTIPYEITCRLGRRVRRIYLNE